MQQTWREIQNNYLRPRRYTSDNMEAVYNRIRDHSMPSWSSEERDRYREELHSALDYANRRSRVDRAINYRSSVSVAVEEDLDDDF